MSSLIVPVADVVAPAAVDEARAVRAVVAVVDTVVRVVVRAVRAVRAARVAKVARVAVRVVVRVAVRVAVDVAEATSVAVVEAARALPRSTLATSPPSLASAPKHWILKCRGNGLEEPCYILRLPRFCGFGFGKGRWSPARWSTRPSD